MKTVSQLADEVAAEHRSHRTIPVPHLIWKVVKRNGGEHLKSDVARELAMRSAERRLAKKEQLRLAEQSQQFFY